MYWFRHSVLILVIVTTGCRIGMDGPAVSGRAIQRGGLPAMFTTDQPPRPRTESASQMPVARMADDEPSAHGNQNLQTVSYQQPTESTFDDRALSASEQDAARLPSSANSPGALDGEPIVQPVSATGEVSSLDAIASDGGGVTMEELEQLAFAQNPAIAEMQSRIDALCGKRAQALLPPNPTVGVNGEDLGEDGRAGRYGVFFGRRIVRGNKLELSAAIVDAEIKVAQQRLVEIQQRLSTDVRMRFYDLLVAQSKVDLAKQLVEIARSARSTAQQLLEAKEVARTDLLQAEVELQNAEVILQQSENQRQAARRKLVALVGQTDLAIDRVQGHPEQIVALADFDQAFESIIASSPELAALYLDVQRAQRNVARQCAQPIPDLTWQTTIQYDTVSDNVVTGFQIGMPLPILNRNQGAIRQARNEVLAAQMKAEKKELDLRHRLAVAYEQYYQAQLQVDAMKHRILPTAKESLELISKGYETGEVGFLTRLTAQRTYIQANLSYIESLRQVWRQGNLVRGLLLRGGLQ